MPLCAVGRAYWECPGAHVKVCCWGLGFEFCVFIIRGVLLLWSSNFLLLFFTSRELFEVCGLLLV